MPTWNQDLSNLRNILAGLYWNQDSQHRIVIDAGINPIYISFDSRVINTWQSILEQALFQGKLDNLIAKAKEENPNVQALALAQSGQLGLVIEPPSISEGAWQGPRDSAVLEKLTYFRSTLRPISFLEQGLQASRAVCRVVLMDGSRGSGFLTDGNILITNNHVINTKEAASSARVEFNYQKTIEGRDAEPCIYELDSEEKFMTSPVEKLGGDDWTAVQVRGNPNAIWGALPLTRVHLEEIKVGDEVNIIQHPAGEQKQIAMSHNTVAAVTERRLQYLTDTLEGSSGSPVFNVDWQVVALHHAGGWLRDPNSKLSVYRNQGVFINIIIDGLENAGFR